MNKMIDCQVQNFVNRNCKKLKWINKIKIINNVIK